METIDINIKKPSSSRTGKAMEHKPEIRYTQKTKKGTQLYFDEELKHRDRVGEYRMYGSVPHELFNIQGAIGKDYVVKDYKARTLPNGKRTKRRKVVTKFPDMSGIIATADQRGCRNLFKEAQAFASRVVSNEALKAEWAAHYCIKVRKVYSKALSIYMQHLRKGVIIPEWLLPEMPVEEVVETKVVQQPVELSERVFVNGEGRLVGITVEALAEYDSVPDMALQQWIYGRREVREAG
jgi:hypothetical protein